MNLPYGISEKAIHALELVAFWKLDIAWDKGPDECVITEYHRYGSSVIARQRREDGMGDNAILGLALEKVVDYYTKEALNP